MSESALARRIRIVIAAAALCAAVAGCAADMGAATPQKADGGGQLRYYGGPKSPMWSSQ
jgi:Spy/CpxP family protein refolding chaperone